VAVTDAFMEAVRKGEKYDLISPRTGEVIGQEDANEIFELIIEGAWATGEPGVFFIDQANRYNPVPKLGSYEATNPCGEQPLLAYDVCNLGSVNVGAFARPDMPDGTPWEERIDWEGLRQTVHLATHFLDNVIDANQYPLEEIDALAKKIRRIGLGIMGWADLLVRVGVPYNSEEGIALARQVMAFLDEEGKKASEKLAETRGTFEAWKESIWGPDKSGARDAEGNRVRPMRKLRNCNVTTVAPTGTISIIADCSGGIEPLFAVAFMRNQAGVRMPDVNKDFVRLAREQGWYSEELMQRIAEEGHIHFEEVPEALQQVFVTAHDVTPEWHIRMQAAFQEHVDSAISKTCNFPKESTREDVREIYLKAHELSCKGVTVYRDGSRPAQVLSTGRTEKKELKEAKADLEADLADAREKNHQYAQQMEMLKHELQELEARHQRRLHKRNRPAALHGVTRRIQSPLGDLYVTINEDEDSRPFELFATLGKAGGAAMADAEAIGRLVSLALRSGISLAEVHQQLRGISCDRAVGFGANKVLSMPDAIAQVIAMYDMEKAGVQQELPMTGAPAPAPAAAPARPAEPSAAQPKLDVGVYDPGDTFLGSCPECSSELTYQEGCVKCHACGYSECG
ncbi:MAG: adenosylcobalamin-dependent ribonucleoside-diphosphate reductase, partial [Gemmatimonadota bacterium]